MADENSAKKEAEHKLHEVVENIRNLTGIEDVDSRVDAEGNYTVYIANRADGFSEPEKAEIAGAGQIMGLGAPDGGEVRPDLQESHGIKDQFEFKGNVSDLDMDTLRSNVGAEINRRIEMDHFRQEEARKQESRERMRAAMADDKNEDKDENAPEQPVAEDTAPEQPETEAPAQPVAEDDEPEIVGDVPELSAEQLAPTPTDESAQPAAEDDEPEITGEAPELGTDPLLETPTEETPEELEGLLAEQGPGEQAGNVFDIDEDEEKVEGMEIIGVTPARLDEPAPLGDTSDGPAKPDDEDAPATPDGISDLVGDQPKLEEDDSPGKLYEDYVARKQEDDDLQLLNAREHFQKIMEKREGRSQMDPDYLGDIKGLKYTPENDTLKINIGFGKNIMDSPEGVQMATGFFSQESAEMMMAVVRTHDWSNDPIKLHGSKSQKNKLWLAAMRQGVQVDVAFQPSKKYMEKWKADPMNPANQDQPEPTPEELYAGVTPGEQSAEAPVQDSGTDQVAPEQAAEELEADVPGQEAAELAESDIEAPAQEAVQEAAQETTEPVAEDVNPVTQDIDQPDMDEGTANATPEEIDEYKATVDARISATIDDLSAQEGQTENVQQLREAQEALQGGQFDVQTLERVDNAVFNRKFSVALSAVKPDDSAPAPIKQADLGDSAPVAPKQKNDGGMKL